jgi:hypothetical protein
MSDREPTKVYVTQPHPASKKDGKLWRIGGLPADLTKEEAEAIVDAINGISWLMDECHACGHILWSASTACPQCNAEAVASWFHTRQTSQCQCQRCAGGVRP